jgi:hypothetical protein
MMKEVDRLVDRYGRFEKRVRRWTEVWCRSFCSNCGHVCCRSHYCDETRQSAFLARVAGCFSRGSVFNHASGWLRETGCNLVAGRPPVCYEFLCRSISEAVSYDSRHRHALLVTSMVITHVGKKAINGRHLVEATQTADLKRIRLERFLTRLEEAETAFRLATDILDGRPAGANPGTLARIVSPPRNRQ